MGRNFISLTSPSMGIQRSQCLGYADVKNNFVCVHPAGCAFRLSLCGYYDLYYYTLELEIISQQDMKHSYRPRPLTGLGLAES